MNPDYSLTEETKKKYADLLYFGWKKEFTEEGRKEGRISGIIEMIKGMLKKNIPYKDISDISGESIEEIKEIEKSMK